MYHAGYIPISLRELVQNYIAYPAGKSPVVTTFDDAIAGQFHYIGGKIDPNCAVAIMKEFHSEHTDKRFVSDGDPETVTIPKSEEARLDMDRLHGKKLRVY